MFKHVDSFTDIPAKDGDMVFVDVIPLQHTDGAIELLRRGVEVYYLRRLTLITRKREELKLSKTARNDIKVLMSLEERWFRRVSEDFLVMRRMISAYRTLMRTYLQFTNKCKAVSEDERSNLRPVIKALKEQMEEMAAKISEEAGRRYPVYNGLVEDLGIDGNLTVMEALAEMVIYIGNRGFRKAANLFGLFKPVRGKKKIYDGRLRQALQRLTASANNIAPFQLTAKLEKQMLFKVWKKVREAQGRLVIPAQG